MLRGGRGRCGGLLGLVLLVWADLADAENPDRFYMSGQAAIQSGAITADSSDGGSIWYNPAGLARMQGLRFDVNVSAYALRLGGVADIEAQSRNSTKQELSVLNFAAVPSGAAFTKRLKNWTVGFGIFVPKMEVEGLRTHVLDPERPGGLGVDLSVDYHQVSQAMYAGPSFGVNLGPGVDFGMSLFVNYRSLVGTVDTSLALSRDGQDVINGYAHELDDWLELGVSATMGVQIALTERLRLGLALRLPTLRVFQILDKSEISSTSTTESLEHSSKYKETLNIPLRLLYPPRLNTGMSYQFRRTHVAVEIDYQAPLRNEEIDEYLRPFANYRLGVSQTLKSGTTLGGGLFTNFSANRKPTDIGQGQVNYYGISLAARMGTAYEVGKREGRVLKPPGRLVFGSTFAFTYSLGLGTVMHAQVGFDPTDYSILRNLPVHVTAHEWILSVGSSLLE